MSFQRLLNFVGKNAGDVAKSVLPGSALAAGFGLLEGPGAALTYGLADAAVAMPATLAARALGTKITKPILSIQPQTLRNALETTANVGASIGSTVAASNLLYGNRPVTPTNMSQEQQLMQQMTQRADVNNLQVQAVAPGTQFQTAGLEFLNDYTKRGQQGMQQYLSSQDAALLAEYGGLPRG